MIPDQAICSLMHDGDLTVQDADIVVRLYAEALALHVPCPSDYMLNRFGICLNNSYLSRGLQLSEQEYIQKMTEVSAKFKEIVDLYLQGLDPDSIVVQLTDKVPTRPSTPVGTNTPTPPLTTQYARSQQAAVRYTTVEFVTNDQRENGNKRTRVFLG